MTIERALRYGEVAAGLALAIVRLVKSGKAERVEKILPSELLTTLERARAELEAEARYAEHDGTR